MADRITKASNRPTLLELRLLVGFLGERAQFGWWPTGFYDASSRLFLEPVFAKTSRLAQYHGVVEAARLLHDEHLSVGSYHLFRMPEEIEQDLHSLLLSGGKGPELAAVSAKLGGARMPHLARNAEPGLSDRWIRSRSGFRRSDPCTGCHQGHRFHRLDEGGCQRLRISFLAQLRRTCYPYFAK